MARKIIQIATGNAVPVSNDKGGTVHAHGVMLYALADDGTVWAFNHHPGRIEDGWSQVQEIPQ